MLKVKISLYTDTYVHMSVLFFTYSFTVLSLIFTYYYIHNIGKTLDYGETLSLFFCVSLGQRTKAPWRKRNPDL